MVSYWGLDMKEVQWSKFGTGYMFGNRDYHLRRTKFIVYQLAMVLSVVSQSLGTAVLTDLIDSQSFLRTHSGGRALEHNDDYVGMASYNMGGGIFVAFVFGGAFFIDLFWPERRESRGVRTGWRVCSLLALAMTVATVVLQTVIVAKRAAYVTGVPPSEAASLLNAYDGYPLAYNKNSRAIVGCVFAWLAFPFVVASTVVMWLSIAHDEKHGPWTAHAMASGKARDLRTSGEEAYDSKQNNTPASDLKADGLDGVELGHAQVPPGGAHARGGGAIQSPIGDVAREGVYPGT